MAYSDRGGGALIHTVKMNAPPGWSLAVALLLALGSMGLAVAPMRAQQPAPRLSAKSAELASHPTNPVPPRALEGVALTTATATATVQRPEPMVAPSLPSTVEGRLLAVIGMIEQQRLDAALEAAASLTADVPNFQAAQLVYADLLRFKSGKLAEPASPGGNMLVRHAPVPESYAEASQAWQHQLRGLRAELTRRVQSAGAPPTPGSIPREFLQIKPSVRHAIAVDASRSRLYLFANENGTLRLAADFYVSIGKLGMHKREEGDQRTPEGMYFVGRRIHGVKLPHFYGKGALTLNYPNDWDRTLGRGGSGIWLHGAPPDQFARLPEASDGCIVLANPDMLHLMSTIDPRTPVLVRDQLRWAPSDDGQRVSSVQGFESVLEAWHQGWASADAQAAADLYEPALAARQGASQRRLAALFRGGGVEVRDASIFSWQDEAGEIRIVNLIVESIVQPHALSLRQYWRRDGGRWRLFSEDVLS